MFDPSAGGDGAADFGDIGIFGIVRGQRRDERPVVTVNVDDARGEPAPCRIDYDYRSRSVSRRGTERDDHAIAHQDHAALDPAAGTIEYVGIDDQSVRARQGMIAARV